jgi:HAD superfamily hydrolase (TIGR01549 family)
VAPVILIEQGKRKGIKSIMIRAVIFDIDGTLLDTEAKYSICTSNALWQVCKMNVPQPTLRRLFGLPISETCRSLGVPEELREQVGTAIKQEMKKLQGTTAPYPYITYVLSELQKKGYLIGLATSRSPEEVAIDRDIDPIRGYARYISATTGDMKPKPAPDVLLNALELCGAACCEAVYIGDTQMDLECAENAGVAFISARWNQLAVNPAGHANTFSCITPLALARTIICM